MKIRTKLTIALLSLVLATGAVGYLSLARLQQASRTRDEITADNIAAAKQSLLLGSAAVAVLAGLGGLALAGSISAPINELTRKAAELAGVDEHERNSRRTDEVTRLASAFERMTRTLRQQEDELRKEKETLDKIISLNPYSIGVFDKDGHILRWNRAFIELCKEPPPKEYSLFDDPFIEKYGQKEAFLGLKEGKIHEMPEMRYNTADMDPNYPDNPLCLRVVSFPIVESS